MVNRVAQRQTKKCHSRKLHHSAKVDHLGQLLSRNVFQTAKDRLEHLAVPSGDVGRIAHGVRPVNWGKVKFSVEDPFKEALFSGHNVPGEFESGFCDWLRTIIAFVQGMASIIFLVVGCSFCNACRKIVWKIRLACSGCKDWLMVAPAEGKDPLKQVYKKAIGHQHSADFF